jgi:hypothetical protein
MWRFPMQRRHVFGVMLAFVAAGCAHYDNKGRMVRTGPARFDAQSVSAPGTVYTLAADGTWAGISGDRYELVGDDLRKVGAFGPTPSLIRPSGWVTIDRRPDGLMYLPSYPGGRIWTFVTEDGQPIPAELEIPLYLAAQLGLGGQWIDMYTPGSEQAGVPLESDCATVLFDIQGRQVAGFVGRQGAACPDPSYPGKQVLAKLNSVRNEVWESPARPPPP